MSETADILQALRSLGMLNADVNPTITHLPGGVSSDVFRVDLPSGPVCVKQALARLKVAADWRAPVERVHNEAAWLRFARAIVPENVPQVLAEDRTAHLFVMTYFDPSHFPCWKTLLRDETVDVAFAASVGKVAAQIHRASAHSKAAGQAFATGDLFMALRIDPYLHRAAEANPRCAGSIKKIANDLGAARVALMHGDLSPKNILAGPKGPILLDAETACYGDPAFDLAFCLNHLLLKCIWRPAHTRAYCASFAAFKDAYFGIADWEDRESLDRRAAKLLAALLLARVDGKSPVEYIISDDDRSFVRTAACEYLLGSDATLTTTSRDWESRIGARKSG
jgi:aminoglycoside phosphotransferase (APT) family kinase protein